MHGLSKNLAVKSAQFVREAISSRGQSGLNGGACYHTILETLCLCFEEDAVGDVQLNLAMTQPSLEITTYLPSGVSAVGSRAQIVRVLETIYGYSTRCFARTFDVQNVLSWPYNLSRKPG